MLAGYNPKRSFRLADPMSGSQPLQTCIRSGNRVPYCSLLLVPSLEFEPHPSTKQKRLIEADGP